MNSYLRCAPDVGVGDIVIYVELCYRAEEAGHWKPVVECVSRSPALDPPR